MCVIQCIYFNIKSKSKNSEYTNTMLFNMRNWYKLFHVIYHFHWVWCFFWIRTHVQLHRSYVGGNRGIQVSLKMFSTFNLWAHHFRNKTDSHIYFDINTSEIRSGKCCFTPSYFKGDGWSGDSCAPAVWNGFPHLGCSHGLVQVCSCYEKTTSRGLKYIQSRKELDILQWETERQLRYRSQHELILNWKSTQNTELYGFRIWIVKPCFLVKCLQWIFAIIRGNVYICLRFSVLPHLNYFCALSRHFTSILQKDLLSCPCMSPNFIKLNTISWNLSVQ